MRRVVADLERRGDRPGAAEAGRPTSAQTYPEAGTGHALRRLQARGRAGRVRGRAERLGVEVVAVNPAYVLGPPVNRSLPGETSTRIVGNYLRGRLPAIVDSYTNIVDVEDVADGHLLAARRGRPGERYILGGENLRWSEVIERVAELSGRHHPLIVLPPELASGARLLRKRAGCPACRSRASA